MSHLAVGRGAGPFQALAFENTEPEFDLIEPRCVQRQEDETHPPRLSADPCHDRRMRMNRQIVRHDDEPTPRPPTTERLQQFYELLMTAAPADKERDAPCPHIQAGQDREHPVPTIGLLDTGRPTWTHRPGRMDGLQDLQLRFLVGADDTRPPRRMQIQSHDATDFGAKVGIRTVQPPTHPVRFEVRLAQPSMNGALTDAPNEVPLHRRASEGPHRPVGAATPELRPGATRHGQNIMTFFGGKSGRDARHAACRPARLIDRGQTARATVAPSAGSDRGRGRSPDCPTRQRPTGRLALEAPPKPPSVPPGTGGATLAARCASAGSLLRVRAIPTSLADAFSVSPCHPGYVTQGGSRIYGTVH